MAFVESLNLALDCSHDSRGSPKGDRHLGEAWQWKESLYSEPALTAIPTLLPSYLPQDRSLITWAQVKLSPFLEKPKPEPLCCYVKDGRSKWERTLTPMPACCSSDKSRGRRMMCQLWQNSETDRQTSKQQTRGQTLLFKPDCENQSSSLPSLSLLLPLLFPFPSPILLSGFGG